MHAYQFRVTGDSPCHVHIMVPVVVIHHVGEREREREGGREREGMQMLTKFRITSEPPHFIHTWYL